MKMIYKILYKNGHEEELTQEITEENKQMVEKISENLHDSMKDDASGVMTLGDGETSGTFLRLSEVVRVSVKIKEDNK